VRTKLALWFCSA